MKHYNVLDISRFIINYSNEKGYGVSHLKLQKLLYFIQAYYLSFTDQHEPCFDEAIEAWDFGPVIPIVFNEYKQYGSCNIPTVNYYFDFYTPSIWNNIRQEYNEECISENDRKIIGNIITKFADYSATDLVTITHKQSPWIDTYIPYLDKEIATDVIRDYFEK